MDGPEASRLYSRAILIAVDRLRADGLMLPQVEAKMCLALHGAVEETFGHTSLGEHLNGFLGELQERIHASLTCEDAHSRQACLPPIEWVPEGDE